MPTNHANLPTPHLPTSAQWITHIHALIAHPLADAPFTSPDAQKQAYIDTFADEYASRRLTDRPFLAHLFNLTLDPPTNINALDQHLWWVVQSGNFDAHAALPLIAPAGALIPDSTNLAIEYRTMVELGALHALWLIANRSNSSDLIARCLDAAAWHTRELQPDNAINRPWAIQVFIALSQQSTDAETAHLAHLHAQTLIHNACVNLAAPDILSALILKDAANQLTNEPRP